LLEWPPHFPSPEPKYAEMRNVGFTPFLAVTGRTGFESREQQIVETFEYDRATPPVRTTGTYCVSSPFPVSRHVSRQPETPTSPYAFNTAVNNAPPGQTVTATDDIEPNTGRHHRERVRYAAAAAI